MENLKIVKGGSTIELTVEDMTRIKEYYDIQNTADYLRENHEDMREEQIQRLAVEIREEMDKCDCTESEAITAVLSRLEEEDADMTVIIRVDRSVMCCDSSIYFNVPKAQAWDYISTLSTEDIDGDTVAQEFAKEHGIEYIKTVYEEDEPNCDYEPWLEQTRLLGVKYGG